MSGAPQAEVFSLASELEAGLDRLTDETFRHMEGTLPEDLREPPLWQEVRSFTRDSIQAELQNLKLGGRLPERCPEIDAYGARRGAETDTSLSVLLDGYRAGHRAQWEAWWGLIERSDFADGLRAELLRYGSSFFFRYAARLSALVTDEYMAARDRMLSSQEHRRMLLVRELLESKEVDAGALEYPLARRHLGCLAWGSGGDEAARELAKALDGRLLLLAGGSEVWWAWVGIRDDEADRARERAARFDPPPGVGMALGIDYPGRDGFRRTHRQALAAYRAALRFDRRLVRYRDIALEFLASRDEEAAREFIAAELRGLAGNDARSRRLRTTLLAYFASGQNARQAARMLRIHHQTVAARLKVAEERIGYPVARRRLELETALRLARYLGP